MRVSPDRETDNPAGAERLDPRCAAVPIWTAVVDPRTSDMVEYALWRIETPQLYRRTIASHSNCAGHRASRAHGSAAMAETQSTNLLVGPHRPPLLKAFNVSRALR